jgi:uncharacterized membrane protein YkgB
MFKQKHILLLSRISIFIVFFWFGFIKIFGLSPANGLVQSLLEITLPFIPFSFFIIFLGAWESLIGVLFLFKKTTKAAFWLMMVQMFTTFGPLVFLPDVTWQYFATPTIEGQYIIKNVMLVSLGLMIYSATYMSRSSKAEAQ